MLASFKSMVETLKILASDGGGHLAPDDGKERLAVAALLVHAATADGHMDAREEAVMLELLGTHYRLEEGEAAGLLTDAKERETEAVEIYAFTRVIQTSLSQEERQAIIRLMWEVAVADGEIHEFEANLVWRTAELIGVSTRDRVRMRQEVIAAAEGSAGA